MLETIIQATRETLGIVAISSIISIILGFIIAILIYSFNDHKSPLVRKTITALKNSLGITDNIPYLIVILLCVPIIKYFLSYNISIWIASTIPIALIGAIIFARDMSGYIDNIPTDITETINLYGATKSQIVLHILLPEIKKETISSITNNLVLMISLSTIIGIIGAGGLGELAIDKSLNNFSIRYLLACSLMLYSLINLIKYSGKLIQAKL